MYICINIYIYVYIYVYMYIYTFIYMQYADIYMVKYGTVWYGELYARSTQEYRNIGCW